MGWFLTLARFQAFSSPDSACNDSYMASGRHVSSERKHSRGQKLDGSMQKGEARQQAADSLAGLASNAKLRDIVAASEEAIVSKDLSGIIQTWNEGAERVYGYPGAEAIGQKMNFLVPPGCEEEETEILERIRRGERVDHFETLRI